MKRIVTAALALLLITGAAQAQKAKGKSNHRKARMEQLNLTPDQQAKMKTINEAHRKQRQELKKQDNITVKEWKARKESLTQKHRTEVAQVLTKEQQQQLKKAHSQHRKGGRDAAFGQRKKMAAQQLALTEAQKTKMQDLNKGFKAKREALRSNTALDKAKKQEQMKALAQQHRQEVKAILTPEQQQKMDALRQERRGKNTK